jgi:hypothetical protein
MWIARGEHEKKNVNSRRKMSNNKRIWRTKHKQQQNSMSNIKKHARIKECK